MSEIYRGIDVSYT